jgi:hypothetical protein
MTDRIYQCKNTDSSKKTYLQGTSIAEGERPGFLATIFVDSIKVDRGFFFRLSTR